MLRRTWKLRTLRTRKYHKHYAFYGFRDWNTPVISFKIKIWMRAGNHPQILAVAPPAGSVDWNHGVACFAYIAAQSLPLRGAWIEIRIPTWAKKTCECRKSVRRTEKGCRKSCSNRGCNVTVRRHARAVQGYGDHDIGGRLGRRT